MGELYKFFGIQLRGAFHPSSLRFEFSFATAICTKIQFQQSVVLQKVISAKPLIG
jgi:hypothetical protein